MGIAELRRTIREAFQDAPRPGRDALIRGFARLPGDRVAQERLRDDLAGKAWQDLPAEFLAERWPAFCYLTAAAYRYYLPALLLGALDRPIPRKDLLHATVYSLRPSFHALYYHGSDERFLANQAAFTPPEFAAVCAFLGWAFTERPRVKHMAAQALRWGWTARETPARERAMRYYSALHAYEFPELRDPGAAELVRRITSAFAGTPYPGDDNLCGSEQGDEPAEYAMELRGVPWHKAHPDLLKECYAAPSFLSPAGFRYYLPAFLRAELAPDSPMAGNIVFHLTHSFTDAGSARSDGAINWREYSTERYRAFTRDERLAIIAWLEMEAQRDELSADEIQQALDTYWLPSIH